MSDQTSFHDIPGPADRAEPIGPVDSADLTDSAVAESAGGEGVTDWAALGARFKYIREYLNLSQQAVAAATGISRSAISDIERGERKVDSLELRKFSRVYRYPVGYLLGEQAPEAEAATALGRALSDLTDADREELLRFAQFLRFNAQTQRKDRPE
jgi:transcriptional regulator with XRE-family HTH domain